MNVKLLRRVAKHISEEPRRFIMGEGIVFANTKGDVFDHGYAGAGCTFDFTVNPPCGTAACIAGTAVVLTDDLTTIKPYHDRLTDVRKIIWPVVYDKAVTYLKLTEKEADRLFLVSGWGKFRNRFLNAKTPRGRVNAAIARMEHFIKTKGAE